jgi:transketolase
MAIDLEVKLSEYMAKCKEVTILNKGSHLGGVLSMAHFLVYLHFQKHNHPERDFKFILSKGHAALGYYVILSMLGIIEYQKLLTTFNQTETMFSMHPCKKVNRYMEYSSGSLGMGVSFAVGKALALKKKNSPTPVYCILGDGELNEGACWEGFMAASHFKLDNLVFVIDHNKFSHDGPLDEVMSIEPLAAKLLAFGMSVAQVNGHQFSEIGTALDSFPNSNRQPIALILDTVKGYGCEEIANTTESHYYYL